MTLKIWADPIATSEASDTTKYIRFSPLKNTSMDGLFVWMLFKDVVAFTDLKAKLYSDRDGIPGALIATTSTTYTRAQCLTTYNNGYKYLGFQFSSKIPLNKDTYYHIVMNCSNYTYAEESHMALVKAWPDPVYQQPATYVDLLRSPYNFGIMGAAI